MSFNWNLDVLLLLVIFCVVLEVTPGVSDPFNPPVLPKSFSVQFAEVKKLFTSTKLLSTNNGSWYYDYNNLRARFDHFKGQKIEFCQHQNLSDHEPDAPCHLLFAASDDLFVHYPEQKNCCCLCGKEEGCTVLRPDWMKKASTMYASEFINHLPCYGWVKAENETRADFLLVTYDIVLCRYSEVIVNSYERNLTFYPGTYVIGPQDPDLFDIPDYCHRKCPRPFPTAGLIYENLPFIGKEKP